MFFDIFWIYNVSMDNTKAKRGRPPKADGQAKSESILLRLDPAEKAGFTEAANVAGLPLTVWMRERMRRIAAEELRASGKAVPFLH